MVGPESPESPPVSKPAPTLSSPLRLPARGLLVAWGACVAAFGLAWGQQHWQIPHPHPFPLVLLLAVMPLAAAFAGLPGLWRVAAGPRRFVALAMVAGS